jgi:hypothetical protein
MSERSGASRLPRQLSQYAKTSRVVACFMSACPGVRNAMA